jgi:ornithine carbamoyltransferase
MPPGTCPVQLGGYAEFRGRHYLNDQEYSRDELPELLQLAVRLKALLAPQAALHQTEDA